MIEDEEFNFNLSQYLIENDDDDDDDGDDHEAVDKISMTLKANYDMEQDEDYLSTNGMYLYDNDEDNDECHVSTASSVCTIATLDSFLSKLQEQHIISNAYDCEAVVNVRTKQRRNANNDQEVQDSRMMMMRSRKAISTNDLIHNFKLKSNNRNENEVYIYIYA